MINIQEHILLKKYTTLGIGGYARCFVEVNSESELKEALQAAKKQSLPFLILAGGSNLLVSDNGYDGLVIKLNYTDIPRDEHVSLSGEYLLHVKAGTELQELVDYTINHGVAGFEKLAGIPGTVGGAIYGNAGAFGQTISDFLQDITVTDGDREFIMNKDEIGFEYRDSGLKRRKELVILSATFNVDYGETETLRKSANDCLEKRKEKYPPEVKCPGSFFKNVLISDLPKDLQKDMPNDYYGKVPAWWFLERVDAKGAKKGNIKIMDYHANLFINEGGGYAQDFFDLAKEYKDKVKEKFGVSLEPEVQLIGFKEDL